MGRPATTTPAEHPDPVDPTSVVGDDPDADADADAEGERGRSFAAGRLSWAASALIGVAAAVPRLLTAGNFQTVDETLWMTRSARFADAVVGGHLSHLAITSEAASTMPGITTMWIGSLAKGLFELGQWIGLVPDDRIFEYSTQGVAIAQSTMAVATALLIGLVAWLVARWSSARVGVAFGLLLATEPFWVAHGSILHTDELLTLFGSAGLVCLAIALGVPRSAPVGGLEPRAVPRRWAVAAGVLLACAALTKLSGLVWGASAAIIFAWAIVQRIRDHSPETSRRNACRPLATGLAIALGCAVATTAVLYPALWADPGGQWTRLAASFDLGRLPRESYFRGGVLQQPPLYFYAYVLPWRTTPWALAVVLVAIPFALARQVARSRAIMMLAMAVPPTIVLALAEAKYTRYGLMILAPLLLAGCLALQPHERDTAALGERAAAALRFERAAWLSLGVVGVLFACSVAPYGLVYFNPLLGGGRAAQSHVPVGWYEEGDMALASIREDVERRGGTCDGVTTTGYRTFMVTWAHCGRWVPDSDADYLVVDISMRQHMSTRTYRARIRGRELVDVDYVQGIRYVEIWRQAPEPVAARIRGAAS